VPSSWLDGGIKAVIFDAVGTLLFPASPVAETYRNIARKHGADIDETVLRVRLRDSFELQERIDRDAGWRTSEDREANRWRNIVRECLPEAKAPKVCFDELWEWYRSPAAWKPEPDTETVLNELTRRGFVVGMASNFDARLAGIVNGIPALRPLNRFCVISSLVGWRKPSTEFFGEVIKMSKCDRSEVLFVGDDLHNDYHGALSTRIKAVLYDPSGRVEGVGRIARLIDLL
jgi:putative hydrolase of the HAD superfamily